VREALAGRASRGQLPITVRQRGRMLSVTALPAEGVDGAILIAIDETRLHELEQTRRDFVSSVSHELRTPLSSINLMIETILSTGYEREALQIFLPRVKQEVDRMVQLVVDLLDLARSEAGRLRLRTEELDLASVAANIVKTFEPRVVRFEAQAHAQLRGSRATPTGWPKCWSTSWIMRCGTRPRAVWWKSTFARWRAPRP
jgi:signal transduction histidine kinase